MALKIKRTDQLDKYRNKICKGLVLCALGDFCLDMELHPEYGSEIWFISGLLSFLFGHIYFLGAFTHRSQTYTEIGYRPYTGLLIYAVLGIYACAYCSIILP